MLSTLYTICGVFLTLKGQATTLTYVFNHHG
jgi:hypothetical protein